MADGVIGPIVSLENVWPGGICGWQDGGSGLLDCLSWENPEHVNGGAFSC